MSARGVRALRGDVGCRIRLLPRWAPMAGTTFGSRGTVWLKDVTSVGVLKHEMVHLLQARELGWRFRVLYLLSGRRRAEWEAEAYAVQVVACAISEDRAARLIASRLYLWPVALEAARRLMAEAVWRLDVARRIPTIGTREERP